MYVYTDHLGLVEWVLHETGHRTSCFSGQESSPGRCHFGEVADGAEHNKVIILLDYFFHVKNLCLFHLGQCLDLRV